MHRRCTEGRRKGTPKGTVLISFSFLTFVTFVTLSSQFAPLSCKCQYFMKLWTYNVVAASAQCRNVAKPRMLQIILICEKWWGEVTTDVFNNAIRLTMQQCMAVVSSQPFITLSL